MRYINGQKPQLTMLNAEGEVEEVNSITKWPNADAVVDYLMTLR